MSNLIITAFQQDLKAAGTFPTFSLSFDYCKYVCSYFPLATVC